MNSDLSAMLLKALREASAPVSLTTLVGKDASKRRALQSLITKGQIVKIGSKNRSLFTTPEKAPEFNADSLALRTVRSWLAGGLRPIPWSTSALQKAKVPFPWVRPKLRQAIKQLIEQGEALAINIGRSPYLFSVKALRDALGDRDEPSDQPISIAPTQVAAAVRKAYVQLVEKRGTRMIKMASLVEITGLPQKEVSQYLQTACAEHTANPLRGEPTMLTPAERSCFFEIDGQPYHYVELL